LIILIRHIQDLGRLCVGNPVQRVSCKTRLKYF